MKLSVLLLLVTVLLICQSSAKTYNYQTSMSMFRRSQGWLFMDRMSFDAGVLRVKFSIKIKTQHQSNRQQFPVDLAIIPSQFWEVANIQQCLMGDLNGNVTIVPVDLRKSRNYYAEINYEKQLTSVGSFYFVLRDCEKSIGNQYFRKDSTIVFNLQMKNGQFQHGSDQHINIFMLPILLFATLGMLYFSKGPKHNSIGEQRDWAKLVLFITLIINFVAIVFYYFGFLNYYFYGHFSGFFEVAYLLFHSLSEGMITFFLLMVAYGWTINYTKDAQFDLYLPLISMLALINIVLTLLGKINDGDSQKYHMYDSIPSYLLVFFRIFSVIVFIIGIVMTYSKSKKNPKVVSFLANFGLMGALYFFSLPSILVFANFIPAVARKQVVFFSIQFVKNLVNAILTWMVSSKKSKYQIVKQSSQTFFQEGNKIL